MLLLNKLEDVLTAMGEDESCEDFTEEAITDLFLSDILEDAATEEGEDSRCENIVGESSLVTDKLENVTTVVKKDNGCDEIVEEGIIGLLLLSSKFDKEGTETYEK